MVRGCERSGGRRSPRTVDVTVSPVTRVGSTVTRTFRSLRSTLPRPRASAGTEGTQTVNVSARQTGRWTPGVGSPGRHRIAGNRVSRVDLLEFSTIPRLENLLKLGLELI